MRAYERMLKYVTVYTASDDKSSSCPSTARQFDLAKIVVEELKEAGVKDAFVDEFCYVYGTVPATEGYEDKPALGFIAHMDTVENVPADNVKPILHENYDGKDLVLGGGTVLSVEKFPFLAGMKGETLITSDGTTLLGADNKAGVAEIVTAVGELIAGGKPHGKICISFTPDEEIGRGADKFDIPGFGADFAYTVDGGDVGGIEYENFNGASASVKITGFSVHPGDSKDTMINASNVAMEFHMALPEMDRPEHTVGYEGFYHLTDMSGNVSSAKLNYILRDHDYDKLNYKKQTMEHVAACLNEKYGEGTVELFIEDRYRNMIEQIKPHFHLVETAREAIRMTGMEPVTIPIRGGTDGAKLSWLGLPCPNLGTGGFNYHGTAECITAERMDRAVDIIKNIIELYSK